MHSVNAITRDDSKSIFGWCMYDWANSAYGIQTVILTGLLSERKNWDSATSS